MKHWHLTHDGAEAPRPRLSPEPTWRRYRPDDNGRNVLGLAPCTSPVLTAPGKHWNGLCERRARAHGWPEG
jgi:hypothetical protein